MLTAVPSRVQVYAPLSPSVPWGYLDLPSPQWPRGIRVSVPKCQLSWARVIHVAGLGKDGPHQPWTQQSSNQHLTLCLPEEILHCERELFSKVHLKISTGDVRKNLKWYKLLHLNPLGEVGNDFVIKDLLWGSGELVQFWLWNKLPGSHGKASCSLLLTWTLAR